MKEDMTHNDFCLKYPELVTGCYNDKFYRQDMFPHGCQKGEVQYMIDTLHTPIVSLSNLAFAIKIREVYMESGIHDYDLLIEDFNEAQKNKKCTR